MKGEGCGSLNREILRRLRWRCRRGLLELDVWLSKFAATQMESLSDTEAGLLEALLEEPDMSLLDWLEGRQTPPTIYIKLIEDIRASV